MDAEIQYIPFNKLTISPLNVRTVDPARERDKELLASIRAEGVLQNLIVHRKGKKYAVCAGGRRFAALSALREEGTIKADEAVPCKVAEDEQQAVEWSLHENSAREAMHPADEFVAYLALIEGGKTVKEVAADFGVSQAHVKRLLKLASVAPALIEKFRAGELDLDDMQAFAVTDDHEAQLACLESLPGFAVTPYRIRQVLLGQSVRSDHRLAKFVGVKAYRKAGGEVNADLFENVSYLADHELLVRLARERLEETAEAVRAEGWKWVEVKLNHTFLPFGEYPQRVQGELTDVPKELTEALEKAKADQQALMDKPMADWTEEDSDRDMALDDEIERIEERMDACRVFTDDQRAQAGAVLLIDYHGQQVVERGLMTTADVKALRESRNDSASDAGENADAETVEDTPVESQALRMDLANYRLQARQAALLKHPGLAHDLLIFTLAEQMLGDLPVWDRGADIEASPANLSATDDIEGAAAAEALSQAHGRLDLGWMVHEDRPERFTGFQALTKKKKEAIMAYCVARTLQWDGGGLTDHLAELMGFDLLDYWRPTAENYFRRVKAAHLLEIGAAVIGPEWADEHRNFKKGQLVEALSEAEEMSGWLPDA